MGGIDFDGLVRILQVEAGREYADRTVIGGLEPYLQQWVARARQEDPAWAAVHERALSRLAISYHELDPARRQRWVAGVLQWIGNVQPGRPGLATASQPQAKRAKGEKGKGESSSTMTPPSRVPGTHEVGGRGQGVGGLGSRPTNTIENRSSGPLAPGPRPPAKRPTQRGLSVAGASGLEAPLAEIKGIAQATAVKLQKLGVETVREALFLFPRRHQDFSQRRTIADLEVGAEETVVATIWQATNRATGRGVVVTEAIVGDETGNLLVVWFNQPYLTRQLASGAQVVLSGKVTVFQGRKQLQSPEYELLDRDDLVHTGRLVPIYPLTEGLSQRQVRRLIKAIVDHWAVQLVDHLPPPLRARCDFLPLPDAVGQMHYPDTAEHLERARRRLAFDELFAIQLAALRRKRQFQEELPGYPFTIGRDRVNAFLDGLPFHLTGAQSRVREEILADLGRPKPMTRLLQGEVGSGKTVVAAAVMLMAVENGFQAALMAPTEILAEQHHRTLSGLLEPLPVGLLVGSLRKSEKDEQARRIVVGEVPVVVGTHALIQQEVEFSRLGLVVVDEQHRFGVLQRQALRQKGYNPHLLVMTATPIPRSLALTLYGDLDLSLIDELPPGRQEIKTRALGPEKRQAAYNFIRQQVEAGRQAFIICPLIEESEKLEVRAATAEHERLSRQVFPDLRIGLLHGRLRPAEKDEVMRTFRAGELDVLVSTAVVEVGIDVPNATVMLVEGADRFGLAQLHQFRGRVGRGEHASYCMLVSETASAETRERLALVETTRNGLELAEADLKLRGPGEFFGTRQSGLPDLRLARLSDLDLLEVARREATAVLDADPDLSRPEHKLLAARVARLFETAVDDVS